MKPRVWNFKKSDILRSTAASVIRDLKFEVRAFSNPRKSFYDYNSNSKYLFNYSTPSIIISDVLWPLIFEYEAHRNFLSKADAYKFFAFMPTGQDEEDILYAGRIGCKIFQKPFDLKDLLTWLNNCRKQIN